MRILYGAGLLVAAFVVMMAAGHGPAYAGEIDPNLVQIMNAAAPNQPISVLVFLEDRVDVDALKNQLDNQSAARTVRHETVVTNLHAKSKATQGNMVTYLEGLKTSGLIDDFHAFWIINGFEVAVTKGEIERLAARSDVAMVYYNYEIETIAPVDMTAGGPDISLAIENGVNAVRAPEVWAMGITGAGVLVSNIDTGVEGDHPALASRWAGVADSRYAGHPEWAWYDPYLGINDFPYDDGGHGTHTMGTICGGAPGDQIGVAPGAYWIAAAAIDRGGGIPRTVSDAILSFQWMLDPDGNPSTSWDVPDVCSNSWGVTTSHGYAPCDPLFWSYIDACEAAGTVVVFAAGNEGTSGLRRPGDRATDEYRNFAVAAVDGNTAGWPIAYFSSRGPTYCTPGGTAAIKPDISGPGVNVRSAYPGLTYTTMSGTSMATPHVAGVIALIRQANPNLTPDQIKQIIYETAYDLGSAGEDNDYGYGMIDAYEAVMLALGDSTRPSANFSATPMSGCAPLAVAFTDLSTGEITGWSWTFGDGGTSTAQNPAHTYTSVGNYTVSLTVTGPSGTDTETKANYISALGAPTANFIGSPTSGGAPLTVYFTDQSTGTPSAWSWTFGDGGTSTAKNPSHVYNSPGLYTVTLTASNACGSDGETKANYINVTEQPLMHVSSITVSRIYQSRKWYGVANVTIVNQYNQPVSGATVTGFFNSPDTKPKTGVTGGTGIAVIQSKAAARPPADWCFEVTNVTHASYPYNPAANVVTRACESGYVYLAKSDPASLPGVYSLDQNHPNPFNPVTTISFALPEPAYVTLSIYNILGEKMATVVDGNLDAGYHTAEWNGSNVASGIYLYRIETANFVDTKKMVLLK